MKNTFSALVLVLLVTACQARSTASVTPSTPTTKRAEIVPVVAAHQHLLSPASVPERAASLPEIQVPPDLAQLLRDRERVSGSRTAESIEPADVFSRDAWRTKFEGTWARGLSEIRISLGFERGGRRFIPNAYGVNGSRGYIAGTVRSGESTKDLSTFLLATERGSDGTWRISAETDTRIAPPEFTEPVTADQLIADFDDARIQRGVVLSIAYWYGSALLDKPVADEHVKVRAENDWTAQQVAQHPNRLVFFCGVNPLKDYAIQELERCAKLPLMKGIKLHFANSGVDVRDPEHLRKVRDFFRAANAHRLAIVVHIRSLRGDYGRPDAEIFLTELLPAAPDIPIQLAHLAGSGPGYGPDEALAVYAEAIEAGDARTRNLYFDTTNCVTLQSNQPREELELIAKRLRQVGLERVFFGSDMHTAESNPGPAEWWWAFRRKLPLTDGELRVIASNVPPYMR